MDATAVIGAILGIAVAAAVAIGSLRLGRRLARRLIAPQKRQAIDLQQSDPVAADALMQAHFTAQAQEEAGRESALWARARSDARAAQELRALLQDQLLALSALSEHPLKMNGGPDLARHAEDLQRELRAKLSRLDDWARQLGPGDSAA